ncbi:HNH endonuclease [Leptospira levettii]|uniref:HNH endonuclease n=1 Tax=Leptospira levettii TaxID=2023178 RepID=UPI00223D8296|nr:HNH endonuclease [Leptospira levettii]MCW7467541.1 HNH endonuclease [Leptospira levettii]
MTLLTKNLIEKYLFINAETGEVKWKKNPKNQSSDGLAGSIGCDGYRELKLEGKRYKIHRLIWLYCMGSFPQKRLDHINGNRSDNRISNLREVTQGENCRNREIRKGYYLDNGRYKAQICLNGKQKHLGRYDTPEEARQAYLKAKVKVHGEEFSQRALNSENCDYSDLTESLNRLDRVSA